MVCLLKIRREKNPLETRVYVMIVSIPNHGKKGTDVKKNSSLFFFLFFTFRACYGVTNVARFEHFPTIKVYGPILATSSRIEFIFFVINFVDFRVSNFSSVF